MNIGSGSSSILRLTAIVFSVVLHHAVISKGIAAAQLQVVPLWDLVENSTHQSCDVQNSSDEGVIIFQGDSYRSCSLQLTSLLESSSTVLEIPADSASGTFFLYVERGEDPKYCANKYVVIDRQTELCSAVLVQKSFQLHLLGNVSLTIKEIPALSKSLPSGCPEYENTQADERVSRTSKCVNLKSYNNSITCDYQGNQIEMSCRVSFPSSCNASVGNREVVFECQGNGYQNQKLLIIYPYVTVLDLMDNNIVGLDGNVFHSLPNLQVMYLQRNWLHELPTGVFDGLVILLELYLSNNQLVTLDIDVFSNLCNLNILSLYENQLVELNVGVFSKLKQLTRLDLDNNRLTTLPVGLFQNLTNLNKLYLYGNQLVTVDVGLFRGLASMFRVSLTNTMLTSLPVGLFQGLENLHDLYLNANQLISLNASVFQGLGRLAVLTLHDNQLSTLPEDLFKGLYNLTGLYLGENQLVTLDATLFQDLGKLSVLTLFDNNLTELHEDLFLGLDNLAYLYLYRNQLSTMNLAVFQDLSSLKALSLTDNMLSSLPTGLFQGVHNLSELYLCGNPFLSLNASLFWGLRKLTVLALCDSNLTSLPDRLFDGLGNLKSLFMYRNQLDTLHSGLFEDLGKLVQLSLAGNKLTTLPDDLFQGLDSLSELYLYSNMLVTLDVGLFHGLDQLTILPLHDNKLVNLPVGLFQDTSNLLKLFLYENELVILEVGLFQNLSSLISLDLSKNNLSMLSSGTFQGLDSLTNLFLQENLLTSLDSNVFHPVRNLIVLALQNNTLSEIHNSLFMGLTSLRSLGLGVNPFVKLDSGIFKDLTNLNDLFLNGNQHKELSFEIFNDTINLIFLDLSINKLRDIPNLKHLVHLKYLNLKGNPLTMVNGEILSSLPRSAELFVSQHEICECYAPADVNCSAANDRSPYLTCDRLLADRVLVVMMWLIGLNALGGNVFVLAWRQKTPQKNKVQAMLLSSLAMSDLLMGVYMLTVASADIYFGEHFPMQSETWRSGITCRIAGAVSILASEASVFFVTLISIDRLISVRFPYASRKFSKHSTTVIVLLTWIFSLALGIVPSVLAGVNLKFYDNSHVCIGLPLALTEVFSTEEFINEVNKDGYQVRTTQFTTQYHGTISGMYFSTAVFLGLNCLCYLIILGCYVEIVRAVYKSSKRAGLNKEMKEQLRMTAKVAAIVITDFSCWFPIILLGILVQAKVLTLPPSVFAWSVTFVLPINSAINPYLYTIAAIISSRRKEQEMSENRNSQGGTLQHRMASETQHTQLQMASTVHLPSVSAEQQQQLEDVLPNVPMNNRTSETNV